MASFKFPSLVGGDEGEGEFLTFYETIKIGFKIFLSFA